MLLQRQKIGDGLLGIIQEQGFQPLDHGFVRCFVLPGGRVQYGPAADGLDGGIAPDDIPVILDAANRGFEAELDAGILSGLQADCRVPTAEG